MGVVRFANRITVIIFHQEGPESFAGHLRVFLGDVNALHPAER